MERRIVYENSSMNNPILRNSSDEIYYKKMEEIRNRENKFVKVIPIQIPIRRKSPKNVDLMYMYKVQKDNEFLENKIKQIIHQRSVTIRKYFKK
jgi:hypothetical protein